MAEGNGQTPLTTGEFTRWAEKWDRQLEKIDTQQREHGEAIAVLMDRAAQDQQAAKSAGRNSGSIFGAIGGLIAGFVTGLLKG